MAYTPKDGYGAMHKNDKGDNPARPDYRGDIMLGGVLYEVSGWIKPLPSDASKRFMSLSGKPKQAHQAPQRNSYADAKEGRQKPAVPDTRASQGSGFDDMEDNIPF